MQPPFVEEPMWRLGCHRLQGTLEAGPVTETWNVVLDLSDWDATRHTFNASLRCPENDSRCSIDQPLGYKFQCDRDGKHCRMEVNLAMPTSTGAPFQVHRIYGDVRNIHMDFETEQGHHSTPLNYFGNPPKN